MKYFIFMKLCHTFVKNGRNVDIVDKVMHNLKVLKV